MGNACLSKSQPFEVSDGGHALDKDAKEMIQVYIVIGKKLLKAV
jgi:hypothetical protein